MEEKKCTKCKKAKPVSEFYLDSKTEKPRPNCKSCMKIRTKSAASKKYKKTSKGYETFERDGVVYAHKFNPYGYTRNTSAYKPSEPDSIPFRRIAD